MRNLLGIAAVLAVLVAAPAVAAPAPNVQEDPGSTDPRRALDSDLPTDRPIVATVIEIDGDAGMVLLSTPHGTVELSVSRELAARLTVGDVVVVRFADAEDDDAPYAAPREPAPAPGPLRI